MQTLASHKFSQMVGLVGVASGKLSLWTIALASSLTSLVALVFLILALFQFNSTILLGALLVPVVLVVIRSTGAGRFAHVELEAARIGAALTFSAFAWVSAVFSSTLTIIALPGSPFAITETKSLPATFELLWKNQILAPCVLLFVFSIIIPIAKLLLLVWYVLVSCANCDGASCIRRLSWTAPYQLLDVYVAALFACFFNNDVTDAQFDFGFYCFFVYCSISIWMFQVLDERIERPQKAIDVVQAKVQPLLNASEDVDVNESEQPSTFLLVAIPAFLSLVYFGITGPMLEVRYVVKGLTVDVIEGSAMQVILGKGIAHATHPLVLCILAGFTFTVPFAYVVSLLILELQKLPWRRDLLPSRRFSIAMRTVAADLQPWAMLDVLGFASTTFLLMAQQENVLVRFPSMSSWSYAALLAASMIFVALRFFPSGTGESRKTAKFVFIGFCLWLLWCLYLLHGIPTRVAWLSDFSHGVQSICDNLHPVMETAIQHLPASYGQCGPLAYASPPKGESAVAPEPCFNAKQPPAPLEAGDLLGLRYAINWITGLNSFHLDSCSIGKGISELCGRYVGARCLLWCRPFRNATCEHFTCVCPVNSGTCASTSLGSCVPALPKLIAEPVTGDPQQPGLKFKISGTFGEIRTYIDLKQCFGNASCVRILSSADHCCGKNLSFALEFEISCPKDAHSIASVNLTSVDILDPIVLDQKFIFLDLASQDVAPIIQSLLTDTLRHLINTFSIHWGGRPVSFAELLTKLIVFNSPDGHFSCMRFLS